MSVRRLVLLAFFLSAGRALGQAALDAEVEQGTPLDRLGALVKDGKLAVEADFHAGRVPVIPKYVLEVTGTPTTSIACVARDGKVETLHFAVKNGKLIVRGSGLRPKVSVESLDFESPKGVTNLKFRGLGIWRPIVAIFGGIARSAVRKMEFRTDIPSILRGEVLGAPQPRPSPTPAPGQPPAGAAPPSTAPPPSPTPAPSVMELLDEARINELTVTAFGGRPMNLRPFVAFRTAANPESGEAMKLTMEKGVFRPARGDTPAFVEISGHLDGEIEDGVMEFEKNRSTIAKGRLQGATFQAKTGEDGKLVSALQAENLSFELSSGLFVVPGGLRVELDGGSTFAVKDLKVTSAGSFSGVAGMDLAGKTGEFARKGTKLSASNIHLRSQNLAIVNGRATGPVELAFDYELQYPFVVKYPIAEIAEKRLLLDFHGPFSATLALSDAGGEEGEVTGNYRFKAPWDPIEQAALLALAAKWQQDLAIKHIDFAITPRTFRPCGESCFTLAIEVTAEKKSASGLKKLFSQFCAPVGTANLFVDKPARAFILKDVKIETHCRGAVGFIINFIAPLLTKTYSEMKLFEMPPDLPLSIDSVRGGAQWVEISGSIDWEARASAPPARP